MYVRILTKFYNTKYYYYYYNGTIKSKVKNGKI